MYYLQHLVDRALQLSPNDATVLHMRGRWSFTIANLSWFERKAVATMFGALPDTSIDAALADFIKVQSDCNQMTV